MNALIKSKAPYISGEVVRNALGAVGNQIPVGLVDSDATTCRLGPGVETLLLCSSHVVLLDVLVARQVIVPSRATRICTPHTLPRQPKSPVASTALNSSSNSSTTFMF